MWLLFSGGAQMPRDGVAARKVLEWEWGVINYGQWFWPVVVGPCSRPAEVSRGPAGGSCRMKWHSFFMKSRLSYLVRLKQARRRRWMRRSGDRPREKRALLLPPIYLSFPPPPPPPFSVCFTLLLGFTQKQPFPPTLLQHYRHSHQLHLTPRRPPTHPPTH